MSYPDDRTLSHLAREAQEYASLPDPEESALFHALREHRAEVTLCDVKRPRRRVVRRRRPDLTPKEQRAEWMWWLFCISFAVGILRWLCGLAGFFKAELP
jgi:replication fork clamp-binding protein CrfC